jgi:hypothetical protein
MERTREEQAKPLGVAMVMAGLGFVVFYPLSMGSGREGWVWAGPERSMPFEHMLYVMYVVLGLFLLRGAREPLRHMSLVNYTIVANLIHATAMLIDGWRLDYENEHLGIGGDVVGTYAAALILLACHPTVRAALRQRRLRPSVEG